MSPCLVDSNILLDVLTSDPTWGPWSEATLKSLGDTSTLVINPIIYAEVSISFASIEELENALPNAYIAREDVPFDAAFLAGKCFLEYRRRGGSRPSTLPDFFIGAHAAVAGYRLVTRDAKRFRTYFPRLSLVSPDLP